MLASLPHHDIVTRARRSHSSRSVPPRLPDCTRGRLFRCSRWNGMKVVGGRGGRTLRLQHVVVVQQRARGCALRQIQLYTKNRNDQGARTTETTATIKRRAVRGGWYDCVSLLYGGDCSVQTRLCYSVQNNLLKYYASGAHRFKRRLGVREYHTMSFQHVLHKLQSRR